MSDAERRCRAGHVMTITNRFRFDHEPGDSARDTLKLARFAAMGLRLGADVTVWYCAVCDCVDAVFIDPA